MIQYQMIKQSGAWLIRARDTSYDTHYWWLCGDQLSWGQAIETLDQLIADDRAEGERVKGYVLNTHNHWLPLEDIRRLSINGRFQILNPHLKGAAH